MRAGRRSITALTMSGILLFAQTPGFGWGFPSHRLINLVAAESLPNDMPAFIRTPEAAREISYFGPEPDRWTPKGLEPELSAATVPDHYVELELARAVSPLPRKRYDFLKKLEELQREHPEDKDNLTPQQIGTLPWQVEEIFERLEAAFRTYRIVLGAFPAKDAELWGPMSKDDLPDIETSILFYSGWLGHYIGDGSMPLHTVVNLHGWMVVDKRNPEASPGSTNSNTTTISVHHTFELLGNDAVEHGAVTAGAVRALVPPARQLNDPFVDTLTYLENENRFAEAVYRLDREGQTSGSSPEAQKFIEARMAEGSTMLRDLIYSAWLGSAASTPVKREAESDVLRH